jgi:hypothetical protein
MSAPAKLKLIDVDLLLEIIRASKGPIQPPVDQDLYLSSKADENMTNLLNKTPSLDNQAKINDELNNQSTFLEKFRNKDVNPPSIIEQPTVDDESENNISLPPILQHFGKTEKSRVQPILERLGSKNSHIQYNDNLELIINGNRIPDSNIIDLVKAITGKSKKIPKTPGLALFIKGLKRLNIPLYSAGSNARRRLLETGEIGTVLDPLSESVSLKPRKRKKVGTGIIRTNTIKKWI